MLLDFEFYTDEHVDALKEYFERNYIWDDDTKQLVSNILYYVSAQDDDSETIFCMLCALLQGVVSEDILMRGLKNND